MEYSPKKNPPLENSPLSFFQIIFEEKMFPLLKIRFSFYQED